MQFLNNSEDYIAATVGMPVYWLLVMCPAFVRAHKIFNPSAQSDQSSPANEDSDKCITAPSVSEVNPDPRKVIKEVMDNEDHPDAALVRRTQGAHENGWEGFIIFVSAVTAAWIAQIDPHYMNAFVIVNLVCRFFYNIAYIVTDSPKLSFVRSFFFMGGMVSAFALYIKAAYDVLN